MSAVYQGRTEMRTEEHENFLKECHPSGQWTSLEVSSYQKGEHVYQRSQRGLPAG